MKRVMDGAIIEHVVLDEVIVSNNKAVDLLRGGQYMEAVLLLTELCRIMQRFEPSCCQDQMILTEEEETSPAVQQDFFANSMDSLMMQSPLLRSEGLLECHCCEQRRRIHQPVGTASLHCQPIVLSYDVLSHFASSSVTAISLSTMFNLALALQLAAVVDFGCGSCQMIHNNSCSGEESRGLVYLRMSLNLYATLYEMHFLDEQRNIMAQRMPQTRNILLLAMLNNSGHIRYMLGETENADRCYQQLLASLMWLRSTRSWASEDGIGQAYREYGVFEVFLGNIAGWMQENAACEYAAPAA